MLKLLYNCAHFTCQQHHAQNPSRSTSEVCEFQDSEIKLPTFVVSCRKQGNSGKTSTSASLTMLKPLTLWITTNCGKSLKTWEYQTTSLVSWETCMQVKKQQSGPDWFKIGKGVQQGGILSPCSLTYMQSICWEMPDWMNHKLQLRLLGEISITSDIDNLWYHSNSRK